MADSTQLTPDQIRYIIAENFPIFDTDVKIDMHMGEVRYYEAVIPVYKFLVWEIVVRVEDSGVFVYLRHFVINPYDYHDYCLCELNDPDLLSNEDLLKAKLRLAKERIWHFGNSIQHTYLP